MSATTVARSAPVAGFSIRAFLARLWHNYILRRCLKALVTIFFTASLTFFVIRLMPGSPVELYVNQLISQYGISATEARDQAAALFSLDLSAPLPLQYVSYLEALARGDLGRSVLSQGTTVVSIIGEYLPWTLFTVGLSLLISFTAGIGLGMLMAYRRESWIDQALSSLASLLSSVQNYLIGLMVVVFLGVQWKVLPIIQMRGSLSPGIQPGFDFAFFKDVLFHATPLIFTYVITSIGTWMLTMKSSTLATLEEDYVTVARARGLSGGRITTAYVGRNAALPLFTQLTIAIGFIVGGSALIEQIFVYKGIGLQLLQSVTQRDYTVMQGIFLIITISVQVSLVLADLLYGVLDPRIRVSEGK